MDLEREPNQQPNPPKTPGNRDAVEPGAAAVTDARKRRQKLIAEYEATAPTKSDALQRNLTLVTADLLGFASVLAMAIKESLPEGAITLKDLQRVQPVMNEYLRLTRQVDRNAQFEVRLEMAKANGGRRRTEN